MILVKSNIHLYKIFEGKFEKISISFTSPLGQNHHQPAGISQSEIKEQIGTLQVK